MLTTNHTVYATTDNVNDAIEWISEQTDPWFVWLAFNAPHGPLEVPPTNLHSYGEFDVDGNERRCFEAMVEALDRETGRLLDFIGTNLTNTTVILMGDNGTTGGLIQPPYSPSRGKGMLYQGGIKVPLIIAGADVAIADNHIFAAVGVDTVGVDTPLVGQD